MKISIIGSGNVGATLAKRVAESELADCVLLDVVKGVPQGKALDLLHAAPSVGYQKKITGTNDYNDTKGSDIVVVTAGFPRQPGMSRGDLVKKNGSIIKTVTKNIKTTSPNAILIIITNPLDAMAYLAYKESGFDKSRVIGMAGTLDTTRFKYILASEFGVKYKDVETIVLGQHGPSMVPLLSHTRISGKPITEMAKKDKLEELKNKVRESGAKIVGLLGKGSAYYAPSAACFEMIKAIIADDDKILSVSCLAQGEYGISGVFTGLPVRLGRKGIKEIVKLNIEADELKALKESADSVKEMISTL